MMKENSGSTLELAFAGKVSITFVCVNERFCANLKFKIALIAVLIWLTDYGMELIDALDQRSKL